MNTPWYTKTLAALEKDAEGGDPRALLLLAQAHRRGLRGATVDVARADALRERAAPSVAAHGPLDQVARPPPAVLTVDDDDDGLDVEFVAKADAEVVNHLVGRWVEHIFERWPDAIVTADRDDEPLDFPGPMPPSVDGEDIVVSVEAGPHSLECEVSFQKYEERWHLNWVSAPPHPTAADIESLVHSFRAEALALGVRLRPPTPNVASDAGVDEAAALAQRQSADAAHAHLRPRDERRPQTTFNGYPMAAIFALFGIACFAFGVYAWVVGNGHGVPEWSQIIFICGFGIFWFALATLIAVVTKRSVPREE